MEYYRKCNICGKIWSYTDSDITDNEVNKINTTISAIGTIASVFGGTRLDTYMLEDRTDRYANKTINYEKCPNCNSLNTKLITVDEIKIQREKEDDKRNLPTHKEYSSKRLIKINKNATISSLLNRVQIFMEEEEWDNVDMYCEQMLDQEPTNAEIYLHKLMIQYQETDICKLMTKGGIKDNKYYRRMERYGTDELLEKIQYLRYQRALDKRKEAKYIQDYECLIKTFSELGNYRDCQILEKECRKRYEEVYNKIEKIQKSKDALIKAIREDKLKISDMNRLCNSVPETSEHKAYHDLKNEILELENRVKTLGLFKRKEKNEINKEIEQKTIELQKLLELKNETESNYITNVKREIELVQVNIQEKFTELTGLNDELSKLSKEDEVSKLSKEDEVLKLSIKQRNCIVNCSYYYLFCVKNGKVETHMYDKPIFIDRDTYGNEKVEKWTNICSIQVTGRYTLGLRKDGTVVSTVDLSGNSLGGEKVESWSDIVQISANGFTSLGLKVDGTVVSAGDNRKGQCEVENWKNIVQIVCGGSHSVGLKADGTVIAVGENEDGECNVENWTNIVSVCADMGFTAGMKSDGTVVVATGEVDDEVFEDVYEDMINYSKSWNNIVEIASGNGPNLCALRNDGRVFFAGYMAGKFLVELSKYNNIKHIISVANVEGLIIVTAEGDAFLLWLYWDNSVHCVEIPWTIDVD